MADSQEKTFSEKLNTWVQTFGIIIGSIVVFIWGVYSFVYKEIIVPKSAPVNVTLNLALKKSGIGGIKESKQQKPFVAIEMRVTAKNPSSREVHLLPSAFIVWGFKIAESYLEHGDFLNEISEKPIPSGRYYSGMHFELIKPSVVAIGNLLTDTSLKPDELVGTSFTFYVPQGEYDMLQANIVIPCAKEKSGLRLEWIYNKNEGALKKKMFYKPGPILWLFRRNANEHELEKDKKGKYIIDNWFEYDSYGSMSIISLWEEPKTDGSKSIETKVD